MCSQCPTGRKQWLMHNYLKSGQVPSQSLFNASGRAYPDISAFATNYEYILNGKDLSVDGTSLSTPAVAGIISILNDIRLNRTEDSRLSQPSTVLAQRQRVL